MTEGMDLALPYAVSAILARSATRDQALPAVLRALCEQGGWNVVTFWQVDPSAGILRCHHAWPLPPARGGALAQLSQHLTFAAGTGLPGRTWASGQPSWIPDIAADETFERALVALQEGIHVAGAVPVTSEHRRHGVVEVFGQHGRAPDAAQVLTAISTHIGHFLERLYREEERRASEGQVLRVMEHLPVVVFALDREGVITVHEGHGLEALGYRPWMRVGRSVYDVNQDEPAVLPQVQRALAGETVTATSTNAGRVVETRYVPLRTDDGEIAGVMGMSVDVTERALREEVLQRQALHDTLTDLPNRTLFLDRLQQAMRAAYRHHRPLALLLLDLNGLKEINATFGHHDGDVLLQQVARRMQDVLRASDTVARLGGDEFAVVLPDAGAQRAAVIAGRMLQALEQPIPLDGHSLSCSGRIGIAVYPDHGDDLQSLVQHADMAVSDAKRRGSGYAVYDPAQDPQSRSQLLPVGDLRQAIEGNQLVLHYQPLIDLRTGRTSGVEALVRWQHPQHGLLVPGQFVPLAERTGLIRSLSRWVLQEAIHQAAAWHSQGLVVQAVVNLSVQDLYDPNLGQMITRGLERWGLPSARLAVEITESTIMTNAEHALQAIAGLHALGVQTAIDDFGTGYSSLAYLKHLPVDEIKIDRSFVRDMTADESDAVIVSAVVDLGHRLGLQVVAEGVENRATLEALARLGCDFVQGYYVSRPLPVDEVTTWLSHGRHRAQQETAD